MIARLILILAGAAFLSACSHRQAAPVVGDAGRGLDVEGVYQYETVLNRGTDTGRPRDTLAERVSGLIRLEEANGSFGGEITATGRSPMPIISVMRTRGNELAVQARDGNGDAVTLRLTFVGDGFNGVWITGNGFSSPVRGVRRE